MDMDDEDGTCLLDVLCDPQALNDFLHGTNELQTEDLLITAPSGEPILFTDAPSPVSLLGDGRDSPDMPPPSCVDLSFLEEALLSSPEGREDLQVEQDGSPVEAVFEEKKAEVEEVEEACDILRQSLQEAEITEQTMALEADLGPTGENLSLYSPAPLLSPPILPFTPKSLTLPITSALPRDTQAVVEPPQPSLLAVGPGCPSLKPAAPPQLMGLLPGNVFPIPSPETSFSPSPAQGSTMIIHKSVPSITSRPLITPTLRAAATAVASTPGVVLQRAPLPIQPKLPISIQPRLVQISPKPSGKKPPPGLTFVPGTASSSILLSQSPGQKKIIPPAQNGQQFPKPVSLQLVNQGGSLVLQPQGLYHGQNHFLLPGQSPVTISQAASTAGPLLTPSQQGPSVHSMAPPTGQLVDGSQILTVPPRQLNFSPVFTTPTGQLALRQASVLSGPLQLQSAPTAVFQMPAQVAGAYTPGGLAQPATLVHSPALANHITFINSSGVLPSDLTSISIVNGPPVVRGLPLAAQTAAAHMDGRLSVQQASVVLLPEETSSADHTVHQLQQSYAHVVQQVSVQPTSSPPAVTVLQSPPEPPPAVKRTPADVSQVEDEEALHSPVMSELLVAAPPAVSVETPVSLAVSVETPVSLAVSVETLASPAAECTETRCACPAVSSQDSQPIMLDQCVESDSQDAASICSPDPTRDTGRPAGPESLPEPDSPVSQTTTTPQCIQAHVQKLQASDNEPAAASVDDSPSFAHDVHPPPAVAPVQRPPLQPSQQSNKLAGDLDQKTDERVTTAGRRRRFHQQVCLDQAAVQSPSAGSAFSTLRDAVGRLLPYHSCAGHLPTEDAFSQVDQEFHAVSAVLLKRTKDMVNKYRQLLLGEAQQDSPSAEMVMLERLFLQVERCALAEDRRRTRRDPETFMTALATSASSPQSGPPSPPAWTRLSDRPPGLKTYRSSSRGALRLTIRQELGSRKVVHNSACGTSLKRDHTGQPANGAAAVTKHRSQTPHGRLWHSQQDRDTSHGKSAEDVLQRAPASTTQSPPCVSGTEPEDHSSQSPPTDVSAPKHKRCQLDVCPAPERRFSPPPAPERRFSPPPAPIPEDGLLSEHLQSAIDSILELQRLQGPSAAPGGPLLDQPVTSILQGPL